jgi:hypothetical protein
LSATPCDSAAFSRAFNSARNGRDQADRALDRLRDRTAPAPAAKVARGKTKAAPPERPFVPEPGYGPRIRDTGFQVGQITGMMEHGWADVYILRTCPGLTDEDLAYCREELAKGAVPRDLPLPKPLEGLTDLLPPLLLVLVLGLLIRVGLMSTPARLAASPTPAATLALATADYLSARSEVRHVAGRGDAAPCPIADDSTPETQDVTDRAAGVAASRPPCPARWGAARLLGAGPARPGMSPRGEGNGPQRGSRGRERPADDQHGSPAEVPAIPRPDAVDAVPGGPADERVAALHRGADRGAGDHGATCV